MRSIYSSILRRLSRHLGASALTVIIKIVYSTVYTIIFFMKKNLKIQTVGIKEFRQRIAFYANQAIARGISLVVLKHNLPIFEVKPLSKAEQKKRAMEKLVADIAEARAQVRRGEVYTLDEVEQYLKMKKTRTR